MLQKYTIEQLAEKLYNAQTERASIPPLTDAEPGLTVDEAYRVQLVNVARITGADAQISGKKIGLTSLAMQNMFNVNEPDYGHLYNTMDMADGKVAANMLLQPKVEGEIAFILKQDLIGPDVTPEQVIEATDYVVAALEIVDSRIKDWKIKLMDTVADNASSGCYVLGAHKVAPQDISLPDVQMVFYKNGQEINRGSGRDVLGNPATCVAWLANKLSSYGVALKAGEVVLSGALSAAVEAKQGDTFLADLSGLGKVEATFV